MSQTKFPEMDVLVTEADVKAAVKGTKLDSPKIIADIVQLNNRWVNDKKRPLHTWCRAHGHTCAMTAIAFFEKRLQQYGTVFKLLTTYVSRSAKADQRASAPKASTKVDKSAPVASKTATPRAKNKYSTHNEVVKQDDNGNTTICRTTIENCETKEIVVQYDSYPTDPNKSNHYLIGTPELRMEVMS